MNDQYYLKDDYRLYHSYMPPHLRGLSFKVLEQHSNEIKEIIKQAIKSKE